MGVRENRWSTWLPIGLSLITGLVLVVLFIASKADASDVASNTAKIAQLEVHLKYLMRVVYLMAQSQGLLVPPPPEF